jgi:hypothetical protein
VPGVGLINLCDRIAWDPYAGITDMIGTEYAGPEDFRGRTLGIYKTEAAAAAALDNAARVLEACPEEASDAESGASSVYTRFEMDEGDESLGWTQRYRLPDGSSFDAGLTVYHLVRVGKAVYASYQYGEAGGSDESIRLAILAATAAASPIVEEMGGL